MNKLQTLVLTALRDAAFGPTQGVNGERWVETTTEYARLFDAAEDGTRPVAEKDFARIFSELQSKNLVDMTEAGTFVRLGDLGLKADHQPKKQEQKLPVFDVKTASTAELVAKFNELTPDKPVKKFADRATAEKRTQAALTALAKLAPAPAPEAKAPRRAAAVPAAPKVDRSAERAVRHNVSVAGVTYRSVAAAFQALHLPMSRHIPFRAKVKVSGQETFEHDGVQYKFKLIEQQSLPEA